MENVQTRRQFLQTAGTVAAAGALPVASFANVHVQGSDEIRVALVGCGGRGGGAASNAMNAKGGSQKLVAMADVFQDRLDSCYGNLVERHKDKMDVPKDRQFIGFDAYKKLMDALKPGDIVEVVIEDSDDHDLFGVPLDPK